VRNTLPLPSPGYSSLIGIPYSEKDCWAIVRDFYRIEFNTVLESYYDGLPKGKEEANALVKSAMRDFTEASKPYLFGDIVLIRLYGIECHIGVYLGEGLILHTSEGSGCVVERLTKWEKLVVGFYRVKGTK
jgi:cell wall-associated NlpC family hydrolase